MAGGRRRQWGRRSSGLRAARRHGRGRGWRGDTDGSDGQRTGAPERRNGLPEEKDDGVMGWQHPARRGGATFWTSVSTALRLASGGTEARPWKRRRFEAEGGGGVVRRCSSRPGGMAGAALRPGERVRGAGGVRGEWRRSRVPFKGRRGTAGELAGRPWRMRNGRSSMGIKSDE